MFFVLKLISWLPFSVLYLLSDVLWIFISRVYRRKVVIGNLKRTFPTKGKKEIEELAAGFYKNFCDLLVEQIKTLSISREELMKRTVLKNPELLYEHSSESREVLVYALHHGNWEWLAMAITLWSDFPNWPIVQKQKNDFADQYMKKVRIRFGGGVIPKNQAARVIIKGKDIKRSIGIAADQTPRKNSGKHWVKFLGTETAFIAGITQLPYLSQLPCYFGRFKRIRRGYYEAEMIKIGDPPYAKDEMTILRNYLVESEKIILESPEQWLWSHKRWKYNRSESEELANL